MEACVFLLTKYKTFSFINHRSRDTLSTITLALSVKYYLNGP
jgi:hypothetical protein